MWVWVSVSVYVCVSDRSSISKPTKLYQQVTHPSRSSHSPSLPVFPLSHFSLLAIYLSTILSFPSFWNHNIFSVSCSLMHCCLVSLLLLLSALFASPISCIRHPFSALLSVKWPVLHPFFLLHSFPPCLSLCFCFSLSRGLCLCPSLFLVTIHLLLKPRSPTWEHFDSIPTAEHTNHTHVQTHTHSWVPITSHHYWTLYLLT